MTATITIGVAAFAFILLGRLFFDLLGAVNAFVGAIVVTTTPWMVIMAIGFIVRRGAFDRRDLQVFNRGETGGRYWFSAGVNWRGMVAWIASAALGLSFAYYPPVIVGWFSGVAGGADISLLVAIGSAAVLYLGALFLFPEPQHVFPPEGPRLVPEKAAAMTPVVADPTSSAAKAHARRG
ncbi:cytosine permease [Microcella flavibacter]|uniref:cytosine permease n=1 Tax=Microcella flavibacter TaxID=1804990 RepID=UPI001E3427FD|nr:cytosine permease [Microcella flavibacter]